MRYKGVAYRALNPYWSHRPLSGDGAALHGGRFNRVGQPTLYLAASAGGALREATQNLSPHSPLTICAYLLDIEDLVDLTQDKVLRRYGFSQADLACDWKGDLSSARMPGSHRVVDILTSERKAGILVPSFAPGASAEDRNLVLWKWGPDLPHRIDVYDPEGRLPRDQRSCN